MKGEKGRSPIRLWGGGPLPQAVRPDTVLDLSRARAHPSPAAASPPRPQQPTRVFFTPYAGISCYNSDSQATATAAGAIYPPLPADYCHQQWADTGEPPARKRVLYPRDSAPGGTLVMYSGHSRTAALPRYSPPVCGGASPAALPLAYSPGAGPLARSDPPHIISPHRHTKDSEHSSFDPQNMREDTYPPGYSEDQSNHALASGRAERRGTSQPPGLSPQAQTDQTYPPGYSKHGTGPSHRPSLTPKTKTEHTYPPGYSEDRKVVTHPPSLAPPTRKDHPYPPGHSQNEMVRKERSTEIFGLVNKLYNKPHNTARDEGVTGDVTSHVISSEHGRGVKRKRRAGSEDPPSPVPSPPSSCPTTPRESPPSSPGGCSPAPRQGSSARGPRYTHKKFRRDAKPQESLTIRDLIRAAIKQVLKVQEERKAADKRAAAPCEESAPKRPAPGPPRPTSQTHVILHSLLHTSENPHIRKCPTGSAPARVPLAAPSGGCVPLYPGPCAAESAVRPGAPGLQHRSAMPGLLPILPQYVIRGNQKVA